MLHLGKTSACVQVDGGATPGWAGGETPAVGGVPKKQRSRWDETPMGVAPSATPMMGGATPAMTPGATPLMTPGMAAGMETPSPSAMQPGVSIVLYTLHTGSVSDGQVYIMALLCLYIAVVHSCCTVTARTRGCTGCRCSDI